MSDGPFLTPREQIEHSISKGITFNNITEAESEQYLVENNNYFKLRAFRKNFLKSTKSGKYVVVSIILCKRLFILNYQTYFVTR